MPKAQEFSVFEVLKSSDAEVLIGGMITDWTQPDADGEVVARNEVQDGLARYMKNPVVTNLHENEGWKNAGMADMKIEVRENGIYQEARVWDPDLVGPIKRGEIKAWSAGYRGRNGQPIRRVPITLPSGMACKEIRNWEMTHTAIVPIPAVAAAVFEVLKSLKPWSKEESEMTETASPPAEQAPPAQAPAQTNTTDLEAITALTSRVNTLEARMASFETAQKALGESLAKALDAKATVEKALAEKDTAMAAIQKELAEARKPVHKAIQPPDNNAKPPEPQPKWDPKLSTQENAKAVFDWQQRNPGA